MYYLKRGFQITTIHVHGEFSPLQSLTKYIPGGPRVDLESDSEHVPYIERKIRVLMERIGYIRHSLSFNKFPKIYLIHLVFQAIKILNRFSIKGSIFYMISATKIVTGESLNYKKHIGLNIGQYCEVHEKDTPLNSNQPRNKGDICMGPRRSIQVGLKFKIPGSMKKITTRSWDMVPMPDIDI